MVSYVVTGSNRGIGVCILQLLVYIYVQKIDPLITVRLHQIHRACHLSPLPIPRSIIEYSI